MTQTSVRLETLGRVELLGAGTIAEGLNRRRRKLAVLALLAMEQRPVPRTELVELFWGGQPEARARHSLSDALSHLRRVLGHDALITDGPAVRLRAGALAVDALELQAAAERHAWQDVLALHRGPFLAGVALDDSDRLEEWLVRTRRRLDALAATACARECEAYAARGDWVSALRLSERWMVIAPDGARARRFNERAREAASTSGRAHSANAPEGLTARWTAAVAGDAGVAIVTGDAAARHSATRALTWRAAASGATTLVVRAYAGEADRAHGITAELARMMADAPGLAGADPEHLATLSGLAPEIGARFSIAPSSAASPTRVVAALRGALESVAYETPCLVVVDDAHLSDAASIATLIEVASATVGPSLLVLSAPAGALPETVGPRATTIALAPPSAPSSDAGPATALTVAPVARRPAGAERSFAALVGAALLLLVIALASGTWSRGARAATGTTRSAAAARLYEQGVREYTAGHVAEAGPLFEAALREDTAFAMAAHYVVRVRGTSDQEALARALRLAERAPDRERLLIRATWLMELNDPQGGAAAETLVIRYPDEVEALVLYGRTLESRGDFASAVRWMQRAVDRDSAGLRGVATACHACAALGVMKSAALFAGSFRTAEEAMRRLATTYHDDEQRARMWMEIALVRARDERLADAAAAVDSAIARYPAVDPAAVRLELMIRRGALDAADSALRLAAASAAPAARLAALTSRVHVLRLQARHREAVQVARHVAALADTLGGGYMDGMRVLAVAQSSENPREAAAIFDSLATLPFLSDFPARDARHRAWMLTLAASARARAGDTSALAALADAVEQIGARSAYGRDRRLHHHIRGLLWEARGDTARAVAELHLARFSRTETYLGVRLARGELALGRVNDAIATAESALRGPLDSQNQYESRTELHEILAQAYARSGAPARARRHLAIVTRSWRHADGEWAVRAARAGSAMDAMAAMAPMADALTAALH